MSRSPSPGRMMLINAQVDRHLREAQTFVGGCGDDAVTPNTAAVVGAHNESRWVGSEVRIRKHWTDAGL
jgi:hypothetical protein